MTDKRSHQRDQSQTTCEQSMRDNNNTVITTKEYTCSHWPVKTGRTSTVKRRNYFDSDASREMEESSSDSPPKSKKLRRWNNVDEVQTTSTTDFNDTQTKVTTPLHSPSTTSEDIEQQQQQEWIDGASDEDPYMSDDDESFLVYRPSPEALQRLQQRRDDSLAFEQYCEDESDLDLEIDCNEANGSRPQLIAGSDCNLTCPELLQRLGDLHPSVLTALQLILQPAYDPTISQLGIRPRSYWITRVLKPK